jgi:hypothetical protein
LIGIYDMCITNVYVWCLYGIFLDIYKEAFEHYKETEEKKFNSKFGTFLQDLHQSLEQPVLNGSSSYGSTSCKCCLLDKKISKSYYRWTGTDKAKVCNQ